LQTAFVVKRQGMNKLGRYIIIGFIVAAVAFLLWYFSSIVAYILISAVLSLMGKPIVDGVCSLRIRNWHPPRAIGATCALIAIWVLFVTFFSFMIPLVISQFNSLSGVDVGSLVNRFAIPIGRMQEFIQSYLPASAKEFSIEDYLTSRISSFFTTSMITNLFSSTANFIINLGIALFAISFITFFFLKDDTLFYNGVILLFPSKFEKQLSHALSSINRLLRRYFIGLLIESTLIMLLDTIWLVIIGLHFQTAIVIGLIIGILNVIPYVGPLIGIIFGTLIGLASQVQLISTTELLPLTLWMVGAMLVTKLIDDALFQPLIYGNSVKSHPLEIFLVLLIAGSLAGVLGMLLAIPTYTVLRVFAKEFFNNFRLVQKITDKI
jgi:predicted PurR-regulated permease PerM